MKLIASIIIISLFSCNLFAQSKLPSKITIKGQAPVQVVSSALLELETNRKGLYLLQCNNLSLGPIWSGGRAAGFHPEEIEVELEQSQITPPGVYKLFIQDLYQEIVSWYVEHQYNQKTKDLQKALQELEDTANEYPDNWPLQVVVKVTKKAIQKYLDYHLSLSPEEMAQQYIKDCRIRVRSLDAQFNWPEGEIKYISFEHSDQSTRSEFELIEQHQNELTNLAKEKVDLRINVK